MREHIGKPRTSIRIRIQHLLKASSLVHHQNNLRINRYLIWSFIFLLNFLADIYQIMKISNEVWEILSSNFLKGSIKHIHIYGIKTTIVPIKSLINWEQNHASNVWLVNNNMQHWSLDMHKTESRMENKLSTFNTYVSNSNSKWIVDKRTNSRPNSK